MEDNHYRLLMRYLAGETSQEENKAFLDWLEESKSHRRLFNECRDIYFTSNLSTDTGHEASSRWKSLEQHIRKSQRQSLRLKYLRSYGRVAAFLVLAFVVGYLSHLFFVKTAETVTPWYEVEASMGSTSRIRLSDSTEVWLNAGSRLQVSPDYHNGSRDVYLEGEGYFSVTKQVSGEAFYVHTSELTVKVLGTRFNVKSYPEDHQIETILEEGSVRLYRNDNRRKELLTLKPNQKATYIRGEGKVLASEYRREIARISDREEELKMRHENLLLADHVNTVEYTSWREGQLIFKSDPLEKIAKELERRYNVTIDIRHSRLNGLQITGNFRNENIEQVMYALKLTSPIDYRIDKNRIEIFEREGNWKK